MKIYHKDIIYVCMYVCWMRLLREMHAKRAVSAVLIYHPHSARTLGYAPNSAHLSRLTLTLERAAV